MNVTSNGYYTQQYLNEQQRKQAVRSPYNQQNFYPNQSYSYSYYHPSSYSHSGSPKEFIVELDEKIQFLTRYQWSLLPCKRMFS